MVKLNRLLKMMNERTKLPYQYIGSDRALYILLERYKNQLPKYDENFHKMFRQTDCIEDDNGTLDYVIWLLISDSNLFWTINNLVINDIDDCL